jgi:hypothetical protein
VPDRRSFLPVLVASAAVVVALVTVRPSDEPGRPAVPAPAPTAAVPGWDALPGGEAAPGWEAPHRDGAGGGDNPDRPGPDDGRTDSDGVDPDSFDSADEGPHGDAAARAVRAAETFARAWSTPADDWWEQVSVLATADLTEALAGVRPVSPPPQVVGPGQVHLGTPAWVRVRVPTDRGDLLLDLVAGGDRWWVAAVDWHPR